MELNGLNLDTRPIELKNKSWVWGQNFNITTDGRSILNQKGFDIIYTEAPGFIIINATPIDKYILIFSTNNTYSKIVKYDTELNTYDTIVRTIHFGFNKLSPISIVYKFNYNNEIIICFWSGLNDTATRPFLLNIDDLPFTVNGLKEINSADVAELARLFPYIRVPDYALAHTTNQFGEIVYDESKTGNIPTGVYFFALSYAYSEYDFTPIYSISQPFSVFSRSFEYGDSGGTGIDSMSYCFLKDNSGQSIGVKISNLETSFDKFKLYVIKVQNGSLTAVSIGLYKIDGSSISILYNGSNLETIEDINGIIIPPIFFEKLKAGTILQNELVIGNYRTTDILDYQKYANNIKVQWKTKLSLPYEDVNDNKSNSTVRVELKGLMPEEVYSLYIAWTLLDGGMSKAYHIPGRISGNYKDELTYGNFISETLLMSDYAALPTKTYTPSASELAISDEARIFQIRDTSYIYGGFGYMGYWENKNEIYTDSDDFDVWGIIDDIPTNLSTLNIFDPNYVPHLRNEPVRHHKAPSLRRVAEFNNDENSIQYSIILALKDIACPEEIWDKVGGFRILYAKRSLSNSTIVGQSPLITADWYNRTAEPSSKDFRFYDYTLHHIRPSVNPRYISSCYVAQIDNLINNTSAAIIQSAVANGSADDIYNTFSIQNIEVIEDARYLPEDTSLSNPANDRQEECLYIESKVPASYVMKMYEPDELYELLPNRAFTSNSNPYTISGLLFHEPGHIRYTWIPGTYSSIFSIDNVDMIGNGNGFIFAGFKEYTFRYEILSNTIASGNVSMTITTNTAFFQQVLSGSALTVGVHSIIFMSAYVPTKFELSFLGISTGDLTFDNISLKQVNNGEYWYLHVAFLKNYLQDCYFNYSNQKLLYATQFKVKPDEPGYCGEILSADTDFWGFDTFTTKTKITLNDPIGIVELTSGSLTATRRYKVVDAGLVSEIPPVNKDLIQQTADVFVSLYDNVIDLFDKGHKDDEFADKKYLVDKQEVPNFSNVGAKMTIWRQGYEFVASASAEPTSWGAAKIREIKQNTIIFVTYSPYNLEATSLIENDTRTYPAFYEGSYRKEFSMVNEFRAPSIYSTKYINTNRFPTTIRRSIKQPKEDKSIKWRTFLADSYYVLENPDKGEITNIESYARGLLINQQYTILITKMIDSLKAKEIDGTDYEAYLGQTDIFERAPSEIVTSKMGFSGCFSPYSTVMCEYGYAFIDSQKKTIFLFDGETVKDIAEDYIKGLLSEYIKHFSDLSNNPQDGNGIGLGYDPIYKNLYLFQNSTDNEVKTFNISYNLKYKVWGFFHTWVPNIIIANRDSVFAIATALAENIEGYVPRSTMYKCNVDNKPGMYLKEETVIGNTVTLAQVVHESYIDIVFNEYKDIEKLFLSFVLNTEVINATGVTELLKTATHIMVYNATQCTEKIAINTAQDWLGDGNISKVFTSWIFNDFKDHVVDNTLPFLGEDKEPNSNVNKSVKNWFDCSNFISKFVVLRLYYDNEDGSMFYLNEIQSNVKPI